MAVKIKMFALILLGVAGLVIWMGTSGIVQSKESVDVLGVISSKAKTWGLDPALVKAVVKVESNFNPMAKNPSDPSYGLMQITPILAQDYGKVEDYTNPTKAEIAMLYTPGWNLDIGCAFLSRLMNKYEFDQAVQSYNVGEKGYFLGYRNSYYLSRVRQYYEQYN